MRLFLFNFFFKFTWWLAPHRRKVDQMFEIYLRLVEEEEEKVRCEERRKEMDACIQPRTETYEHLTCEKQRKFFRDSMPPRVVDSSPRAHYSDYDEAVAYHEGKGHRREG